MLSAVLDDLKRVEDVSTVTLLAGEVCPCGPDERSLFRELAAGADWSLVIAPEFDGILARRCRWVLEAGGRLLGPSPEAVERTADKLALASILARQGVPTPPCYAVPSEVACRLPAVLKPRDGAGSQAMCRVGAWPDLERCLAAMRAERPDAEMVLQPLVLGEAMSVAFLLGPGQLLALPPAAQLLSADGRFRYLGGTVPLPPALARRATSLGLRAVGAVPDLRGYVGVDLILGQADDGSADQVIEMNPRLTTSYIGLRALARSNLAEAMLRVVGGQPVGELSWHAGPVHFQADGTVSGATRSQREAASGSSAVMGA